MLNKIVEHLEKSVFTIKESVYLGEILWYRFYDFETSKEKKETTLSKIQFQKSSCIFHGWTISVTRLWWIKEIPKERRIASDLTRKKRQRIKEWRERKDKNKRRKRKGRKRTYRHCFPTDRSWSEKGRVCVKLAFLSAVASYPTAWRRFDTVLPSHAVHKTTFCAG